MHATKIGRGCGILMEGFYGICEVEGSKEKFNQLFGKPNDGIELFSFVIFGWWRKLGRIGGGSRPS